jgi:hydrogenase maturation protease
LIAGTTPERFIGRIVEAGFDHVIFVDAVECGGAPGSVVFLNSQEMASRFPQVSTHKLSLGMLAKFIEADGGAWAWLLGVQPELLRPGGGLTPPVRRTLEMLAELLSEMLAGDSVRSATGHRPSAIAGSGAVWPTSGWGERPREPETEGVARPAARRESRPTELHHNPLV